MSMRDRSSLTSWVVSAAILLATPAAAADDTLRVAYTGKLLGYARVPDKQSMTTTTCDAPSKVAFDTIRVTTTTVALEYRFDWHQGLPWGRAIRYANPPPPVP